MLRIPASVFCAQGGTSPAQMTAILSGNATFVTRNPDNDYFGYGLGQLLTTRNELSGFATRDEFDNDVFLLNEAGPLRLDTSRINSIPRDALRFGSSFAWQKGSVWVPSDVLGVFGFEIRTASVFDRSLIPFADAGALATVGAKTALPQKIAQAGLTQFAAFLNERTEWEFTAAKVAYVIADLLDKGMRQSGDDLVYSLRDFRATETDIRVTITLPKANFIRTIYFLKPDAKNPDYEWSFTPFR